MTVHFDSIDRADEFAFEVQGPFSPLKSSLYTRFGKRALDVALVLLVAPVVVPLVLVLAGIVALRGGSPIFTQLRVGRYGQTFRIYKLRTMVQDADEVLRRHIREDDSAKAEWASTQKLKKDPRVTAFGRFLRKTSLDELPQLFNVLVGDMSLVGPRPILPEQRVMYPGSAYFWVAPGVTGAWQIADRNNCEFSARAWYDDDYVSSVSLFSDLRILWNTVIVVLKGTGY